MGTTPALVDVATLATLEKSARTFMAALQAAGPAYDRLHAAPYSGIQHILGWGETEESLTLLIEGLEDLRLANGDPGAADYFFFVKRQGATLREAAKDLIDCFDDISRVEPMRRYAESVA